MNKLSENTQIIRSLNQSELISTNGGGWGAGLSIPSLGGILLFADAIMAIADGIEEAHAEKCGCTD